MQALQAQDLLKAALEKPETREVAKKAAPAYKNIIRTKPIFLPSKVLFLLEK